MKYIIKNCPACYEYYSIDNVHDFGCYRYDYNGRIMCKDVDNTICPLKQIIEKCKKTLNLYKGTDNEFSLGKKTYAEFILENFVIQEVEE